MNISSLLARSGRAFGDRPAVAVGERSLLTYRELAARVAALAGGLRGRLGLDCGDRVAVLMTNGPAYLEVMLASWHGGLVAVPINARLHAEEVAYILQHAQARACFATARLAELAGSLQPRLPDLEFVIAADTAEYAGLLQADALAMAARPPDAPAWLFYTSGTTGRPKGAMLTHRNLLAMTCSYFIDVDTIAPGDCILHPAPLSHGSGMYVLPHLAAAALQVVPESGGFDPDEIFALIACHPGASFFAAPTMVRRLTLHPSAGSGTRGNLKTIVYGGGPMYTEDCKRALEVFGDTLVQIYGQGESPMTITALSKAHHADRAHPRYAERLASVGIAHTVVEVAVADDDDNVLPAGETGEVLVRGETVMAGYWRDPDASSATLRGGWLHTGDLGALDDDGFLTLKDRSKDLIINGGRNIYPREVEEVLLRHEAVAEAAVVGRPDPDWGEIVIAFVVRQPGQDVTPDSLDALCLQSLARFKRPRRYVFVDALPKNNYGKVLKTELRRRLGKESERMSS
ncbi:MAG TPA: AMP-binding protein [Rhodospirillales bacterium]|nr:AMP-binding protein [Rhodospirillales bacterium]